MFRTVLFYETKLICRNYLFRLFILGQLIYYLLYIYPWDSDILSWITISNASGLAYKWQWFSNLFQAIIISFIVNDISRKRQKADSRQMLTIHNISNTSLSWADFMSLFISFMSVNVIGCLLVYIANFLIPDSPADLRIHLFYLIIYTVPSLFFVISINLLINRLVRNNLMSCVFSLSFVGFSYFYLPDLLWGLFDFRGCKIPLYYSSINGFHDLAGFLLQRIFILLSGLSFLVYSLPLSQRLCNSTKSRPISIAAAVFILILSSSTGFYYIHQYSQRKTHRASYAEVYRQSQSMPKARILSHDITCQTEDRRLTATSHLMVQNRNQKALSEIPLFLNPGLEVKNVKSGHTPLSFHRNRQLLLVSYPLASQDSIPLEIDYSGTIDEDIYELNMEADDYFSFNNGQTSHIENFGKHTAFLSNRHTLLTPKIMWYPSALAPVSFPMQTEADFTHYTLHVKQPEDRIVLSQGREEKKDDIVSFYNEQNLQGITLAMGQYVSHSITIDSLSIEYYTYPENDFYLSALEEEEEGYFFSEKDPNQELLEKCRDIVETDPHSTYPFKRIKFIEVPISYKKSILRKDATQPELVFISERLSHELRNNPSIKHVEPGTSKKEILVTNMLPTVLQSCHFSQSYTDFQQFVSSERYPGVMQVYKRLLNPTLNHTIREHPERVETIRDMGLAKLMKSDLYAEQQLALDMKSNQMLSYLTHHISWDSLSVFLHEFHRRNTFQEIPADSLLQAIQESFGIDIRPFMEEQYYGHQLARITLKDLKTTKTLQEQIIELKAANTGDADGYVTLITQEQGSTLGTTYLSDWQSVVVHPGDCKHIIFHQDINHTCALDLNYSANIPVNIPIDPRYHIESEKEGPSAGEYVLDKKDFFCPEEIIVDNDDINFQLIDSSGVKIKRLTKRLKDDWEFKYELGPNSDKSSWGHPFVNFYDLELYGNHLRSAYSKPAGKGNFKAIWTAELPEDGDYEIFVYRPRHLEAQEDFVYLNDRPGMKNYYTVYTPSGKEEVTVEIFNDDPHWISLGWFTLKAGKSRVELDDRGITPINGIGQLIVADAVKWIKID